MIPKMVKRQRDFSAGQIDDNAQRRDDRPEFKFGIRYGENVVSSNNGTLKRRAGRKYLYAGEAVRDQFRPYNDMDFQIAFSAGRFQARTGDILVADLVAPWTADMVPLLRWAYALQNIIVTGPSPMRPQVISLSRATMAWSINDYDFDLSVNNAIRAPFYRFEANGVKLTPSARTGSITVAASAATFEAAHVGLVFRYVGKQFRITSYASPLSVGATVLEELPPTYELTVDSTTGFSLGEIGEATTSGFKGEVVAIIDATHMRVVAMKNWYELAAADKFVGPVASATVSAKSEVIPGATIQWDEQFLSDVRGWPQSVSSDVQRIIFCDFPQAKNFILWTAVSAPFDCFLAADATSAILEYIPRECRILHVIGGYDEFALTDSGTYYIPISGGNPLSPGSVEFRQISSGAVAAVPPIAVTEGVIFVDASLNRLSAITATGQTARPYQVDDITAYHTDLFNDIVALAASTSDPSISGRQMYVVNGDGSFCIGRYERDRQYVGWFRETGQGTVTHVSARYSQVVFSVSYGNVDVAEFITPDALMDCEVDLFDGVGGDFLVLANGANLELSTGEKLELERFQLAQFAGATMQAFGDGFYLGDVAVDGSGAFEIDGTYSRLTIGFKSDIKIQPNIEDFEGGESFGQRLRRRKLSNVMLRVHYSTQFRIGAREFGPYAQGDNMDVPLAPKTATYRYRQAARDWDPNFLLEQVVPGPFELMELTVEATV